MFKRKPVTATVDERKVVCLVCSNDQFWDREVKINTSGMEFLGMDWANESAVGLVCTNCGYLLEFAGRVIQLWKTE